MRTEGATEWIQKNSKKGLCRCTYERLSNSALSKRQKVQNSLLSPLLIHLLSPISGLSYSPVLIFDCHKMSNIKSILKESMFSRPLLLLLFRVLVLVLMMLTSFRASWHDTECLSAQRMESSDSRQRKH
jgi:hypothetical protein